jgi:hypothetical protein
VPEGVTESAATTGTPSVSLRVKPESSTPPTQSTAPTQSTPPTRSPAKAGYWEVASNGAIYSFGDAGFHGSLPGLGISVNDVVGMATS